MILSDSNDPTIYFITPTYARHVQKAELTRLSHTILLVNNIHWIVVEDDNQKTDLVSKLLNDAFNRRIFNFKYTHLNVSTPPNFKTKQVDHNWLKPRGVWQRNEALSWLRKNVNSLDHNGVVYFGDDDNTYDLKLFDEIRQTSKVSVFPVGLVGGLLVEKPIVNNEKVVGFNSMWKPDRKFPIDMSGFAINISLILHKSKALFSPNVPRGFQETHLLSQLINSVDQLEPKAELCSRVLVWHTRTEAVKLTQEGKLQIPSNYGIEL